MNLISKKVGSCIDDFNLIEKGEPVAVAYSGGKDSLMLCKTLSELGFDVKAFIIDIGYNVDWSLAVENIKKLGNGISCQVVDMKYVKTYLPEVVDEVENYFKIVEQVYSKQGSISTTICTPCYNAKYIILRELGKKLGIKRVAFGHHGTDAVTSFLKSFFMYEDRWTVGHEKFELKNIYDLVDSYAEFFADKNLFDKNIKPKLKKLLKEEKVSTNEAPMENKEGFAIIRPFFYCKEEEIKKQIESMNFVPTKSECSYFYRKSLVETSREYIQFHLVNKFMSDDVFEEMLALIKTSLTKEGTVRFDARKNRNKLLGDSYKNDGICAKKL